MSRFSTIIMRAVITTTERVITTTERVITTTIGLVIIIIAGTTIIDKLEPITHKSLK